MLDTHCHLADEAFADDLEGVIARARAAGLEAAVCILLADEPLELARATRVRALWPDVIFAAGIHPHRAGAYAGRVDEAALATATALDAVSAGLLGEVGLDYHYDVAPPEVQQAVLAAQADLAVARGLPIVIHTREAAADTWAVLRSAGVSRGIVHCFTGTREEARAALDLGLHVSLSGIVTFPRAGDLRDIAAFVPADRLLVETDAPFLAPIPHRGKRNEPAWVVETCAVVAKARGITPEVLAAQVGQNLRRLLRGGGSTDAR